MTISHFKAKIQLERLAQFKVRRKKIMKSAWSDDGFTSASVENELKINKSETQMLLRQMVEDGDLENPLTVRAIADIAEAEAAQLPY